MPSAIGRGTPLAAGAGDGVGREQVPTSSVVGRVAAVLALIGAVVVVLLLVLGGGSTYTITAQFENASQLVKGNNVNVAGVPVGDYAASHEDLSPPLQAYDRYLLGGGIDEKAELVRERSPITYADRVRTPVLCLIGEHDSRCPPRQAYLWVDAVRARGGDVEVYSYETGHSSFVVDEEISQMRAVLDFLEELVGRVLGVIPVRQVVGIGCRCVAFRTVQFNIIVGGLAALGERLFGVAVLQLVFLVDVGSFAITSSIRQSFDKTWSHVCCGRRRK